MAKHKSKRRLKQANKDDQSPPKKWHPTTHLGWGREDIPNEAKSSTSFSTKHPVTEEERIKILQEKGIRIPPGTPMSEVDRLLEELRNPEAVVVPDPLNPSLKGNASANISWNKGEIPSVSGGKSPAIDFTNALMHGHPFATKAVRAMADAAREQISLADMFLRDTYHWPKSFNYTAKERKLTDHIPAAYRQAMREAHRFELDNEFVRMATDVSNRSTPEKVLYRLQFSTLPYDKTWIEFDLKTKVRAMRAFHGVNTDVGNDGFNIDDVAARMGLLIERVDNAMATVTFVPEAKSDPNRPDLAAVIIPHLTGYIFSVDERRLTSITKTYNGHTPFATAYRDKGVLQTLAGGSPDKTKEVSEIYERTTRGALWGFGVKPGVVQNTRKFLDDIRIPSFLEQHGEVTFSRFYDFFELARKSGFVNTHLAEVISGEITEFTGMCRWIVTVLGMLNEVPVTSKYVVPKHQIRIGLTQKRPALDFHRLTLRLPKIRPVPFIERKLSNIERHHKAHEVMQHWRTYATENACGREEHAWEYNYDEGHRQCAKCKSFGTLIPEHVRGNPELGWVRKDYVIKPTKQE